MVPKEKDMAVVLGGKSKPAQGWGHSVILMAAGTGDMWEGHRPEARVRAPPPLFPAEGPAACSAGCVFPASEWLLPSQLYGQ